MPQVSFGDDDLQCSDLHRANLLPLQTPNTSSLPVTVVFPDRGNKSHQQNEDTIRQRNVLNGRLETN